MDETRCPMCGKANPEQAEVCQFCQARLKPLLKNFDANEPEEINGLPDEYETVDSGIPEWLRNLRQDQPQEVFDNFGQDEKNISSGEGFIQEDDGPQDWLSNLRPEHPEVSGNSNDDIFDDEEIDEGDVSLTDQEIPDWLQNIRSQPGESPTDDQEVVAQPFISPDLDGKTDDHYDWISEFSLPEEEENNQPDIKSFLDDIHQIESSPEVPEWLADLSPFSKEEASHQEDSIPEWLSGNQISNELENEDIFSTDEALDEQEEDWSQKQISSPPVDESDTEPIPDFFQGTIPPFTVDIENFIGDEFPEWLDNTPLRTDLDIDQNASEGEAGIQQGDLPEWLQAMRPIESVSPNRIIESEQDNRIENAGPLLGMQGTLPAEPEIARAKKPPSYSSRLQVSERHQMQANLIEQTIKGEGEPVSVVVKPILGTQQFLRIAIFLVLFFAVLLPMVLGKPIAPPNQFSPEAFMLSRLINQLPSNAPVLLAVDYSASSSGEMDAAALPVIDQLMIKGAHLTIVSTIPTGPMQAERLIQLTNQIGGHKYQMSIQYNNLGYLPGGVTGLLGFVEAPRQLFLYNLMGEPAWQDNRLDGIYRLEDFSMILVLTDDSETARMWIEQVQPELGDTPFGFVVAAQVEPVLAPYFAESANQIQGLVSGLSGGYSYEVLMVRPGIASAYWSSYSVAMLAVLILVIGINLVNSGIYLIANTRKSGNKEQP